MGEACQAVEVGKDIGELLKAIDRELFIDFPEDVGHSKLLPAMAKVKFPQLATMRNWNTVRKLRDLLV